ncbi:hypothetical protein Trco_004747 [Trichoderma cornu-damae]|uniref:Uncharacterized protein n=1 Tax=Trichoderma cornu-damae TaxID=654480 RepID=A0A9P8QI75_9HYPO|nr:hypothetical protein Trco_004747 [Trichoderma cornu-damae]
MLGVSVTVLWAPVAFVAEEEVEYVMVNVETVTVTSRVVVVVEAAAAVEDGDARVLLVQMGPLPDADLDKVPTPDDTKVVDHGRADPVVRVCVVPLPVTVIVMLPAGEGVAELELLVDRPDPVVIQEVRVLRGTELTVPAGEPVLDSVTVTMMGEDDGLPVGAPVVNQIVDKLKEFVSDHERLPMLELDFESSPEVELVAGRGLRVMVTTLVVAGPEPPGLLVTMPDKVSVELRVVGNGGLLEPGAFVGALVQESQVVLNGVTGGRGVPWVPVWLGFQEKGTEWLEMTDRDTVGVVFQIVVVTVCPDGHEDEVVLLNGGRLPVAVWVVPLELVGTASVDVEPAELPGVDTPPPVVVTVTVTAVPAGREVAVESAEPGPEVTVVAVPKLVRLAAVVFHGSWDPVVDSRLEAVEVALPVLVVEDQAAEPDDTVPVSVWTMVVKFSVDEMVETSVSELKTTESRQRASEKNTQCRLDE